MIAGEGIEPPISRVMSAASYRLTNPPKRNPPTFLGVDGSLKTSTLKSPNLSAMKPSLKSDFLSKAFSHRFLGERSRIKTIPDREGVTSTLG